MAVPTKELKFPPTRSILEKAVPRRKPGKIKEKITPFLLTPIRWIKQYDSYQITPHTVRLPITGSFFIFRR